VSAASQRLRNILWGLLGGMAAGVTGELVFQHGQIGVWFLVSAVAAGILSGFFGPVRRAPEIYWSGLLEWCFAGSHPAYPRN
jgi:hypothetical protein